MPALAVNDEDSIGTTNSAEIDENLDSDGDGIPDYLEIYFGTNANTGFFNAITGSKNEWGLKSK